MNLINTVRVKEINDERFTESGAGAKHRHQVSDRRNSNERGSDTSSGRGEPGVHDANRRRRGDRARSVGGHRQHGGVLGRNDNLRGPDQGGARLPRGEPGRGRDRGRPGGADPAAAALVRDRSPRARRAPRGCGRGLVAPRGGRRRDLFRWDGVVLSAGELTEPSPVLELAWQMHAAAFAWSMPALGATFIGAALAAHASGLTPAWQRLLGVVGGGLLIAAGTANLAIADGSALLFVGLPGLAAWLVWLLATGVRLVRSDVD